MERIYFDYAASTPVGREVLKEMMPYFDKEYGNSGSLHSFGQEALSAIDHARESIARTIGANFREIVFTASATEANNLALRGALKAVEVKTIENPRIIVSSIEHESVLETARDLAKEGVQTTYLPVNSRGEVDLSVFRKLLTKDTVLVSIMHASNEIGTIEPLEEIADVIRVFREKSLFPYPLFHTDAAQTLHMLDCNVGHLGVDLMTLSGQKLCGPKGAGVLYVRERVKKAIAQVTTGGNHEFGFRAGTPNVPAIVGLGKGAEIAVAERERESKRLGGLKAYFVKGIKELVPDVEVNGTLDAYHSLPTIVSVYFPRMRAEDVLLKLDAVGIMAASGSACSARASMPSHVLLALGLPHERVMRSIRFSFGKYTTREEISEAVKRMRGVFR